MEVMRRVLGMAIVAGLAAACGESLPTSPGSSSGDPSDPSGSNPTGAQPGGDASTSDGGRVSFSATIKSSAGINASSMPAFDVELGDGAGNSVLLTRVAMVLREVELELENDDGCDDSSSGGSDDSSDDSDDDSSDDSSDDDSDDDSSDDSSDDSDDDSGDDSSDDSSDDSDDGDDDSCEKFVAGPFLLELPLDGSVETVVTLDDVTPGVYDELEFDIHKPEDDTADDLAFIQQNPDFRRISIRVEGDYNGDSFVYETDLNEDQEVDLVPPLVVTGSSNQTNVTLVVDVDSWFRRGDGQLVDPATANKGGSNEKLVEDNIEDSIEGIEDDDFDGDDD